MGRHVYGRDAGTVLGPPAYFLNPEADIWIDFTELEARTDSARRLTRTGRCMRELERAESLYSGDLFEDRFVR